MFHQPKAAEDTFLFRFRKFCTDIIEIPITWFRESIVLPNRQEYPWYHENIRRVPTIDECYTDDVVCIFEADQQYYRDRMVDSNILHILKRRVETCHLFNRPDNRQVCAEVTDQWQNALTNFHIKYGDFSYKAGAKDALMKQKHRMVWERRHGPVGTGMKEDYKK